MLHIIYAAFDEVKDYALNDRMLLISWFSSQDFSHESLILFSHPLLFSCRFQLCQCSFPASIKILLEYPCDICKSFKDTEFIYDNKKTGILRGHYRLVFFENEPRVLELVILRTLQIAALNVGSYYVYFTKHSRIAILNISRGYLIFKGKYSSE